MADVVKVTDAGMAIITNRINGSGTEPKWLDMGTGATPAANDDTALETPGPEDRNEGTPSRVATNVTDDTYRVVGTITKTTAAADITECGTFDALTGGNLSVRATFGAIHLEIGNSIEFTVDQVLDQA